MGDGGDLDDAAEAGERATEHHRAPGQSCDRKAEERTGAPVVSEGAQFKTGRGMKQEELAGDREHHSEQHSEVEPARGEIPIELRGRRDLHTFRKSSRRLHQRAVNGPTE